MPAQNTILSLLSAERLTEHYRSGFWRHDTIYSLVEQHARRSPDHFALRDCARRVTYRQLLEDADTFAGDLARRGVRPGQRVSVWLPSRIETAVALIACSRNGYICCPSLHREYTVAEVLALLTRTRSAVLLVEPGYGADSDRQAVLSAARGLPFLRHVYRLEDTLTHPAAPAPGFPSPALRERGCKNATQSPSPAMRERVPSAARRVRVVPRAVRRVVPRPAKIRTGSSISPSPRGRLACRKVSCTATTPCWRMRARSPPTGASAPRR